MILLLNLVKQQKIPYLAKLALFTNITNATEIFDTSDFENIIFDIALKGNHNISVNMKCHLWKKSEKNYILICDIYEAPLDMWNSYYEIDSIFTYKNKKIKFYTYSSISRRYYLKIPFMYANEEIVNLNDGNDTYYFKFKAGLYYDTNLFLYSIHGLYNLLIPFDDCQAKQREIICKLTRKTLEGFYWYNDGAYGTFLSTMNFNRDFGIKFHPFISIVMNQVQQEKKDLYIEIKKLLTKTVGTNSLIAYETNVKNISFIQTRYFYFYFNTSKDKYSQQKKCYPKKSQGDNPLLLLCLMDDSINTTLSLDRFGYSSFNILSYYNVLIYNKYNESFTIKEKGAHIKAKYPDVLDFSSKDELNFTVYGHLYDLKGNLTLNPKIENVKCEHGHGGYLLFHCTVPKSHFKGEKSGYYSLYYTNSFGEKSIFYEVTPFKVILSGCIVSYKFMIILIFLLL